MRAHRDIFAVVVVVATLLHCAAAKRTFVVGGNLGWKVPPKPDSYAIWASNHTFAVEDILLFHFEEGKHTVAKVSKEAFESCNTTIAPFFIRRNSTAFVSLDSFGVKFFIDTVGDNCLKGQKLAVNVTLPSNSPQQPPASPSPPPSSPPTNNPPTPPTTPSPPSNNPPSPPATPPSSPPPSSPATPPTSPTTPSPPSNNPPSPPATPPSSSPPSSPATPPTSPSPPAETPVAPSTPPPSPSTASPPITLGPALPPKAVASPPPSSRSSPPPPTPPSAATTAGVPSGVVFVSIALGYLVWN